GISAGPATLTSFTVNTAQSTLPFTANLTGADSPDLGSTFSQPLGNLVIHSNQVLASSPGANLVLIVNASTAAVAVNAEVNLASTGFCHAGLIARYSGPGDSNMYLGFLVRLDGQLRAMVYRSVAGVWSKLAEAPAPAGTGILQFMAVGNSLQLSLNGE